MPQILGVGVGRGVAAGPVLCMPDPLSEPEATSRTTDAGTEKAAVASALAAVAGELLSRGERAGGAAKDVLEAQAMMAEDPSLDEESTRASTGGTRPSGPCFDAFAVVPGDAHRDGRLPRRARRRPRRRRPARHRPGSAACRLPACPDPGLSRSCSSPSDLAPADTALLDLDKVLALITTRGRTDRRTPRSSPARSRSSPSSASRMPTDLVDGEMVIVDAAAGVVTTAPSPSELDRAQNRADAPRRCGHPRPITDGALADGTTVPLLANLGSPDGAAEAVALGAEGVGLFRTEFLFLDSTSRPTVEQQRESYTAAARGISRARRSWCACSTPAPTSRCAFLNDAHEENPALGLRGLRALRASEDILREQLTGCSADAAARDRAPTSGSWRPMVPTSRRPSTSSRSPANYGIKTAGVMVEVPSLALLADRVAAARRLRLDRHERPHPVHARGRPPARLGRDRSRTRGIPPCSASISEVGRRRARRTASRSASAVRPRPIRCSPSCSSASARRASRWRPTALADVRASLLQSHPRRCPAHRRGSPGRGSTRPRPETAARAAGTRTPPVHPATEGDTAMTTRQHPSRPAEARRHRSPSSASARSSPA